MKAIQINLLLLLICISCTSDDQPSDIVLLESATISAMDGPVCAGDTVVFNVVELATINGEPLKASSYTWIIYGVDTEYKLETKTNSAEFSWVSELSDVYDVRVELDFLEHGTMESELEKLIEVEECIVNTCDNVGGQYIGTFDGFKTTYVEIEKTDESHFEIVSLIDIVYPSPRFYGFIEDGTFNLHNYVCIECPGLPSPGGTPRYYSAWVSGSGQCFNDGDSIVLFIDYVQTGFLESEYKDNIYLKKMD